MRLALPHKKTLGVAFVALLINSTAAIWTPNYTGKILDAVVHSNTNIFWQDVKFYALLCIITGAFGAVRQLCVSLVGRRIARDVRQQLFGAMMVQDIAFFTGSDAITLRQPAGQTEHSRAPLSSKVKASFLHGKQSAKASPDE